METKIAGTVNLMWMCLYYVVCELVVTLSMHIILGAPCLRIWF